MGEPDLRDLRAVVSGLRRMARARYRVQAWFLDAVEREALAQPGHPCAATVLRYVAVLRPFATGD